MAPQRKPLKPRPRARGQPIRCGASRSCGTSEASASFGNLPRRTGATSTTSLFGWGEGLLECTFPISRANPGGSRAGDSPGKHRASRGFAQGVFPLSQLEQIRTDNHAAYDHAEAWELIPSVLSAAEVELLLSAPQPQPPGGRDRAIMEMLTTNRMRFSELTSSTSGSAVGERTCRCHGKGDKQRVVPLGIPHANGSRSTSPRAAQTRPRSGCEPPQLFLSSRGRMLRRERVGNWSTLGETGWHKPGPPAHRCFTASRPTSWRGGRLRHVQEMLGHASIATHTI